MIPELIISPGNGHITFDISNNSDKSSPNAQIDITNAHFANADVSASSSPPSALVKKFTRMPHGKSATDVTRVTFENQIGSQWGDQYFLNVMIGSQHIGGITLRGEAIQQEIPDAPEEALSANSIYPVVSIDQTKYTAVRLEMKNDALSGPETAGGTRCTVDCYQFELYGPHRLAIKSATATGSARPQDTINDLVNGTGRKRWCVGARLHEVQSATFVLEKSSTITDVAITTSGQPWRGNTRHTVSRLIGIVGDGHERVILDWTDAPSKGGKFKLSTQPAKAVETFDLKLSTQPAKVVETFDLTREGEITHLAVHKDSIISVHRGYTIKQWTLEGRCIRTLKQPAHPYGRVSATAFAVHKGTIICAEKNRKISRRLP